MKILVYCPVFYPSVGGLEINVAQLAAGFHAAGHEVVVVATTANPDPEPFAFRVVRRPSRRELLRLARWCDVFFQANVSLRGLWPLLLVRRPWVVSHQGWYSRPDGSRSPAGPPQALRPALGRGRSRTARRWPTTSTPRRR